MKRKSCRRIIRKRKSFAHELHEFSRKEIGSWFSQASPIKTTAGFSIKSELSLFRHPAIQPFGSWFSQASPIKTTAGFSIKSELSLFRHPAIQPFRHPAPSCHLDQRERSQGNAGDWE